MINNDLRHDILIQPAIEGADKLYIVSGYASPSMVSWQYNTFKDLNIDFVSINLIIGMTAVEGITVPNHTGFIELTDIFSKFNCQYVFQGKPVHSKIYVWEKSDQPYKAFIGSANYTQRAFGKSQRELMAECDAQSALDYFYEIDKDTIYCSEPDVDDCIVVKNPIQDLKKDNSNKLTLSLLTRNGKGDIGQKSGLNWGQRKGREPNQAYIPYPVEKRRKGFFPVQANDISAPHFTVFTDDMKSLVLRVEQQNDKAITTPENNSKLGEYFRYRLGLANGAFVTKEDLLRYGRTDVDFYKIDDEQYYMDFSVHSED